MARRGIVINSDDGGNAALGHYAIAFLTTSTARLQLPSLTYPTLRCHRLQPHTELLQAVGQVAEAGGEVGGKAGWSAASAVEVGLYGVEECDGGLCDVVVGSEVMR